jgi:hypothetical protein
VSGTCAKPDCSCPSGLFLWCLCCIWVPDTRPGWREVSLPAFADVELGPREQVLRAQLRYVVAMTDRPTSSRPGRTVTAPPWIASSTPLGGVHPTQKAAEREP